MDPALSYARTSDDLTIAYTSIGQGPPLVFVPPVPMSNVTGYWRVPVLRAAYERMAARLRVVMLDGRGTGHSERDVDLDDLGLESMLRDLDAVVAHAALERFALFGYYASIACAIAYAARNPDRVTHLVLFGGSVRGHDSMSPAETQALLSLIDRDWDFFVESAAHAWMGWTAGDAGRLAADAFRTATTPSVAKATLRALGEIDVSREASRTTCPALVLHRQAERQIPIETSRLLADALPGGRLVLLEGSAPALFFEDAEADADLVAAFVTDASPAGPPPAGAATAADDGLTSRELDVLRLVAAGESNAEIGRRLGISVHTVERHAANLYRKIDARGRADATAYAIRRGLA